MAFGDRLKYERDLRGWSQAKLAQELGTTPITISNWERGLALPSPYYREQLFALLGKNAQELELLAGPSAIENKAVVAVNFKHSNRQRLLSKVSRFWIKGVLEQSLHADMPIDIGFHEQTEAVENPWHLVLQTPEVHAPSLPAETSIVQVYDSANGELLILGEPGAGKTTSLLLLARELLQRAELDEVHPMPVMFNLSSWSQKRRPLTEWFVDELQSKYQVPRKLGRAWVEGEQVLPLLDGLDEVPQNDRLFCIKAINGYREEHGLVPIVVCSRSVDYREQHERLLLHNAVEIQPLTEQQIDQYLPAAGESLSSVRAVWDNDAVLRVLTSTPLMLSILVQAYRGKTVQELSSGTSLGERRRQLLAAYVERMLERRGKLTGYQAEQTVHWLRWLAQQLKKHGQSEFYSERMQADWLPDERLQRLYKVLMIGVFSLIMGVVYVLIADLLIEVLSFSLPFLPWINLGAGLVGCVLFGVMSARYSGAAFAEHVNRSWRRKREVWLAFLSFGLTFWLGTGLVLGYSAGMLVGIEEGILIGLVIGFIFGLFAGLIGGLVVGWGLVRRPGSEIMPVEVVNWSWARMRKGLLKNMGRGLGFGLAIGVIFAVAFGFAGWESKGIGVGIGFAIIAWLVVGSIVGVVVGLIMIVVGGVSQDQLAEEYLVKPNEGMRRSLRNSFLVGVVGGLSGGIVVGLINRLISWLVIELVFGLYGPLTDEVSGPTASFHKSFAIGLLAALLIGLIGWLRNGGVACMQHGILRLLLWRSDCTPWNYTRFLDYAAERILLRRVGGGYIFVHRLLLEYFVEGNERRIE